MYIATSTEPFDRLGDMGSILSELKRAGFDAYDYSMFTTCKQTNILPFEDWRERAEELRRIADGIGIVCNQSHAPFPTWLKGKEEYNKAMFENIVRAIEITGILGGKVCVVHPCNDGTAEENAAFYASLLDTAKRCRVKIGVENMWNWQEGVGYAPAACSSPEDFVRHMQLLDSEWFVANLDVGHAEMGGLHTSAVQMIYALKGYIQSLHIHDTDKKNDCHAMPFSMNIDFVEVCKALQEIGYTGDVTLEVNIKPTTPIALFPACMSFMANGAAYIRSLLCSAMAGIDRVKIDWSRYPKRKRMEVREDDVVLDAFPNARSIVQLFRKMKKSKALKVWDFFVFLFTDFPDSGADIVDAFADMSYYYLVDNADGFWLVNVGKEELSSKYLGKETPPKKIEIGNNYFQRTKRNIRKKE